MTNLEFYKEDIKRKLCEEHQILSEEEKEYLNKAIRPFRNEVEHLIKWRHPNFRSDKMFIGILCLNNEIKALPYFESNTMYKGMELNKKYTLEELGL